MFHFRITPLTIIALLWFAARASAVEIILRDQATLGSPVVRLGDVADVSAANNEQLNRLITTPLIPAPAPDTVRFLRISEVRDLVNLRGIALHGISFAGAQVVTIGKIPESKQVSMDRLTPEDHQRIHKSVEQMLQNYVQQMVRPNSSSLPSDWNIRLRLDRRQLTQLARCDASWTVSGGRPPWTGKQVFHLASAKLLGFGSSPNSLNLNDQRPVKQVSARTTDKNMGVRVSVTIERNEPVVVAIRSIERGMLVRASDVELRSHSMQQASSGIVRSLESAVGLVAKSPIRADTILRDYHLRKPILVERGETVAVFARSAGVQVRTDVVAKQDGAMGDLVQVETLDKRERYAARVVGRRELEVFTARSTAAELTTLKPRNGQLR